jgi:hypothetical protein
MTAHTATQHHNESMNTMSTNPSREELNRTLDQLFAQARQLRPEAKRRAVYSIGATLLKVEAMQQNNATVAR